MMSLATRSQEGAYRPNMQLKQVALTLAWPVAHDTTQPREIFSIVGSLESGHELTSVIGYFLVWRLCRLCSLMQTSDTLIEGLGLSRLNRHSRMCLVALRPIVQHQKSGELSADFGKEMVNSK